MIPLQLRLHNFMCYRTPDPLDFTGIHLACLAGDNGHGKSALLDAMTWTLWGKARDGKRSADELIHLGETDMEVEFEFDLDSQRYRVIRKRTSRGRGRTLLELQAFDGDRFQPLTEPTIRSTQARIDRLLRMDYETFINSAFLLQGRADEFTVKTPSERKRILGEILNLSLYDEFEERAKERAKAREDEADQLGAQIAEMDRELARRDEYEAEATQTEQDVARTSRAREAAEQELRALQERYRDLLAKGRQAEELAARVVQGERELAALAQRTQGSEARIESYKATLARASAIEEGYSSLQAARERRDELDQKLTLLVELERTEHDLEVAIAQAERELQVQRQIAQQRIAELEANAERAPALRAKREGVEDQLAALTVVEEGRQKAQVRVQQLVAETAALRTRNEQVRSEMAPLQEKISLLQTAEMATCPLCGQELSEDHRDELIAQFNAEGKAKGDQYRANAAQMRDLEQEEARLIQEVAKLERELQKQPHLQRREATLAQQLAETQIADQERMAQQEALAVVEQRLAARECAPQQRVALAQLRAEKEALGYDMAAHGRARAEVTRLGDFEQRYQQLTIAGERLEEELASLQQLMESHLRWQTVVTSDRERQQVLATEVAALLEVESQFQTLEPRVDRLAIEERTSRDRLAAARQKLAYCEQLAQRRKERLRREQAAREGQSIYQELRTAFGKQGIQAMIIESAIPEIEDEANALLARMTDGRMHVRFDTQREKKSERGEFIETLDISISDEVGTRNYSMYSGGEAFRINFAIRIALSKLLARRAGARLQTLVIDEGFGTQDAEGRARLVEAISAIKDDFARVLVITHIEELKDAFPVRIDVQKTSQGSQVTIR
jgi:exonuclease SbcC